MLSTAMFSPENPTTENRQVTRQTEDFHPKVTVDQAEGLCHRITLHFGRLDIETGALYNCI